MSVALPAMMFLSILAVVPVMFLLSMCAGSLPRLQMAPLPWLLTPATVIGLWRLFLPVRYVQVLVTLSGEARPVLRTAELQGRRLDEMFTLPVARIMPLMFMVTFIRMQLAPEDPVAVLVSETALQDAPVKPRIP